MNPSPESAPRLLGREREIGALRDLLDRVREHGGSLLVRGEPGVGKSALLTLACEEARARGYQVLTTMGVQCETELPFAGLHQLLHPLLDSVGQLPAPQRAAVEAAFGIADAPAPGLFVIALATLHLLSDAAADTPILVTAEDAQWLDRPTADVLTFVARRLNSDSIALAVAIRDGYGSPLIDPRFQEILLERLDEQSAEALLDGRSPHLSDDARARVLRYAAGNPLALVELPLVETGTGLTMGVMAATGTLTFRLERAFSARARELPEATSKALLVAAADDRNLLSDVLSAAKFLAKVPSDDVFLQPAVEAGLVEIEYQHVRFRHPLIRSAVYQAASARERAAAHRALGRVFADDPDRRAWHLAASTSGPAEDVAEELDGAANRALRRGATTVAINALQRAAELTNNATLRAGRFLRAAEISFEHGWPAVASRLMEEAREIPLSTRDRGRLVWLQAALSGTDTGDPVKLLSLVRAADQMLAEGHTDLALRLLSAAAMRCFWGPDPGDEARRAVTEVLETLNLPDDDTWVLLTQAYATPLEHGGDVLKTLADINPREITNPMEMYNLGTAAAVIGAYVIARKFIDPAIVELRAQGNLALMGQALMVRAWNETYLGNLSVAVPCAEEARRLGEESGLPLWQAGAEVAQALQAAIRGDSVSANSLASKAEAVAVATGTAALSAMVQLTRGIASLASGQCEEAYHHLHRVFAESDPAYHFTRCWAIGDLAEAAVHCGQEEGARALLSEMERIGETSPVPPLRAALAYARPLLAKEGDAERLFESSLDIDLKNWPFFRGRLLLAYGSWLRRQRRLAESRTPLRTARDILDALGAAYWAEQARTGLRAAGESSRKRAAAAWDQLSPQELHIAQLAAEGLSNREIARRLFLSHRTVGSHLYHIFPKLGVTSRAQLHEALTKGPA